MERKPIKYKTKTVKEYTLIYPINFYLHQEEETKLLGFIKHNPKMTAKSYLRWMFDICKNHYFDFFHNYYYDKSNNVFIEDAHRRSMTDILGCYLTYFPTRDTKKGIWNFIRAFVKVCEEYNYIGHYCEVPEKVVFRRSYSYDTDFKCKWENVPLTTLTWELHGFDFDDELLIKTSDGDSELVFVDDYNFLVTDPVYTDCQDSLTPQNYLDMFMEAL